MQAFLVGFTWDIIIYSIVSFWHAFYTMTVGFVAAFYIFYRMRYKLSSEGVDLKMIYGFKMALFGILIGTLDYMGSNATKGTMESVLKSMGFLTHTSTVTSASELVTLVSVVSSVTTTTTISSDD